jgi:hypothetical protein
LTVSTALHTILTHGDDFHRSNICITNATARGVVSHIAYGMHNALLRFGQFLETNSTTIIRIIKMEATASKRIVVDDHQIFATLSFNFFKDIFKL